MPCLKTPTIALSIPPLGLSPLTVATPPIALQDPCCHLVDVNIPPIPVTIACPPEVAQAIKFVTRALRVYLASIPIECPRN
jgi:hypothetical protein